MPYKLGKGPAKIEPLRRLMLARYLKAADLPAVETSCDWSGGITDFGMHMNDSLGDCVLAGTANSIESTEKCSNKASVFIPDSYIGPLYNKLSPNDNGLVIVDWLNQWRKSNFFGFLLDSYADPSSADEMRLSTQLFGGVLCGIQLTQQDVYDCENGKPWLNVTQGPTEGHCVWQPIFNPQGPVFVTWNREQQCSWQWLNKRLDEAHTLFQVSWLNKDGVAPSGVDWQALHADLSAVTA
jgi:hypothetical protein